MTRDEIKHKVCAFLEEEIEIDGEKLTEDALLKEDLGIDSLDFVDIVVICEREFGFKIMPQDMKSVKRLGQFIDYIHGKL